MLKHCRTRTFDFGLCENWNLDFGQQSPEGTPVGSVG